MSDRCDAVGGSFFESVAPGADAYLLKHVIRDWDHERAAANDLNMLVCTGGRQRSEAEFRDLYRASGFRLTRTVPTATGICVMEGERSP